MQNSLSGHNLMETKSIFIMFIMFYLSPNRVQMYFVQYIYKTKHYVLCYPSLNKMADVTTNEADEVSDTDSSCGDL